MEDLIPFLIFIAIAVINIVKYFAEKGGRKTPSPPAQDKPRRRSAIEDLFEEISRRMAPPPTDVPEWPEGIERPDYVKEMEEYTAPTAKPREPRPAMEPARPVKAEAVILETQSVVKPVSFQSAPSGRFLSGLGQSRISMPPLLRSAAGSTRFELKDRAQLKQALIAKMVFGPPRAYDRSFDNTIM